MSKTYTIHEARLNGRLVNQIKLSKNNTSLLNVTWNPEDKEAEDKAIRSADMTVIRHGLKYETRKLKPVKK